jgi:DNA repair exonuclease SbcCD nuclease subunit
LAFQQITRKRIRLIHTSDTHLGDERHAELSQQALRTVVSGIARLKGDALLLVGDVFDHARVSDATLEFFVQQMGRLAVPAIVLPGNHDLYDETSLYLREPFRRKPGNLHVLSRSHGEVISFPELTLDVWGRAMPAHTPEFRPLLGMEASGSDHWLVALAHGHYHFEHDTDRRSAPIYPQEVADSPCDYLALGHWERHVDVSQGDTRAVYSGSPLGALQSNDQVTVTVADLDPDSGVRTHQATLDMRAR